MQGNQSWSTRIIWVVVSLLLSACVLPAGQMIVGSGKVVTQEMDLRGFEKVAVSHSFQLDLRQADSFRVMVSVDEKLLPELRVAQEGDTLIIGLKPLPGLRLRNATLRAAVTMPVLTGLTASGAS